MSACAYVYAYAHAYVASGNHALVWTISETHQKVNALKTHQCRQGVSEKRNTFVPVGKIRLFSFYKKINYLSEDL